MKTLLKPQQLLSLRSAAFVLAATVLSTLSVRANSDSWVGNTSPNWNTAANWSPASVPLANDFLFFGFAGSGGSVLTNDIAAGTIFNGLTYQSSGSAFTIVGNSIGLNGGITNSGTSTQIISNNITLKGNESVTANTGTVTLAGNIDDGGNGYSLTKLGTGIGILSGVNTFTGIIAVNAGTLRATTLGALPSASSIVFHGATTATLDIQGLSQTLGNLALTNFGSATITITGTSASSLTLSVTPLQLSPYGTTNSLNLNMSALGGFFYNNSSGTINEANGVVAVTSSTGVTTVTLSATTNSITAANLNVGNLSPSGGVLNSTLNFGTNNTVAVGTINVGNGRSGGTLQFASGITNAAITITGTAGAGSRANVSFSTHDSFQASDSPVDLIDLTAGTVNASLGGMTIGKSAPTANMTSSRGITSTSSFKMGAGTLTASTLTMGVINNAAGDSGSYTYNITNNSLFSITNGGTATITNVTLANNNYTGNLTATAKLAATISLTNGATLNATTIQEGSIATPNQGALNVIPQIAWGDGTIGNTPGANLTVSGVNVVLAGAATSHKLNIGSGQTGTINSVISGTGTLTDIGAGVVTLAGNNTFNGSLVMASTNTLTLSGANTYTGSTIVSNGTLFLTGSLTSPTINVASNAVFDVSSLGTLTLNSGQSIIGNGSVNGSVNVSTGSSIIPGGTGVAGTLTFSNNVTLNGQTVTFDLANTTAGPNDQINVGGTLTLNANTTLFINELNGSLGVGTYTLMTYTTLNTNTFNLILNAPRGAVLNIGANALTLTVSGSSSANLTWVGDSTVNAWDIQTTTNWLNAVTPDVFYQNDNVTFDDTGSDNPAINLTTTLMPNSVTVNAVQNYTFSGVGQLSGPMVLTKTNTGTLFLQTTNTYSGGTVVNGGTLEIDTANGAGSGLINLSNNVMTLNIGGTTLPNAVSGSGTINVTEVASATTVISGSLSNFTGVLNLPVSPGGTAKFAFNNAAVNISSNATINIASGSTLFTTGGSVIVAATNNVSGTGNSENLGALRVDSSSIISGPVNLLGNTTMGENASGSGTISGVISDGGNGYSLTKVGGNTSTLILVGANTYSGGTIVSNGTVQIGNPGTNGTLPGNVTLSTNATIAFDVVSNTAVSYNGIISGYGSLVENGIGGTLNLNGANTFTNGVTISAGALWITNASALGVGTKTIVAANGTAGHPELHLNGVSGNILLPSTIGMTVSWIGNGGNSPGVLINEAGDNEVDGNIALASGGGGSTFVVNGGTLLLTGTIAPNTTARNLQLAGAGNGTVSGPIADGSSVNQLTQVAKLGTGTWTFSGTNTYVTNTLVSGGTLLVNGVNAGVGTVTVQTNAILGGSGGIAGNTTVQLGGTLAPGAATIGTLTFSNNLSVSGNLTFRLNKSLVQSNDLAVVGGTLANSGTGTLTLSNLGPALIAGDTFQLFSKPLSGAGTLVLQPATPGTGLAWTNNLAVDGTVGVVTASTVNTSPIPITFSFSAVSNSLSLSWPLDHTGWRLLVQTNHLSTGISLNTNDWTTVAGSDAINQTNITIDKTKPTEFYRLVYP